MSDQLDARKSGPMFVAVPEIMTESGGSPETPLCRVWKDAGAWRASVNGYDVEDAALQQPMKFKTKAAARGAVVKVLRRIYKFHDIPPLAWSAEATGGAP